MLRQHAEITDAVLGVGLVAEEGLFVRSMIGALSRER